MKNLIIAGLLVLSTLAFAQDNKQKRERMGERISTEERVDKRLEKMTSELNLTDDQVKKIKPLLEEQATKRKRIMAEREKAMAERQENLEKMNEEMRAMDSKLKEILTPEQFEKLQANRQDKREDFKEKNKDNKRAWKRKNRN